MAKVNRNTKPKTEVSKRIFLVDKYICNFISSNWFSKDISDREQARIFGIHPNLISKIKSEDGYKIPTSTLAIICFYKGINVSDFFKILEDKYGNKINDDIILKSKSKDA